MGQRHPAEQLRAAVIPGVPEKFHHEAHQPRQTEISEDHLAVVAFPGLQDTEQPKDPQGQDGLVKLGGMQRFLDRAEGLRIGEDHRPGQVGGTAITAAGHEAADPAEKLPHGQAQGQGVQGGPPGHLVTAHIIEGHRQGQDHAAVKDQAAFPEGKNLQRIGQERL